MERVGVLASLCGENLAFSQASWYAPEIHNEPSEGSGSREKNHEVFTVFFFDCMAARRRSDSGSVQWGANSGIFSCYLTRSSYCATETVEVSHMSTAVIREGNL